MITRRKHIKYMHTLTYMPLYMLALLFPNTTHTRIGCISNGGHLGDKTVRQRYDTKEYHYVQCNCPCVMLLGNKQTCSQCGHRHDQRRLIIIDSAATGIKTRNAKKSTLAASVPTLDPQHVIETLIKKKFVNRRSH